MDIGLTNEDVNIILSWVGIFAAIGLGFVTFLNFIYDKFFKK
jgi:hypothetical protein